MSSESQDFEARILEHLRDRNYRPQRSRRLARSMGVEDDDYAAFRHAVKDLMRAGRIVMGGANQLTLSETRDEIIGVYRANPRGFGFVVPESHAEHSDLFIPPKAGRDALTGDRVVARITRRGKGDDGSLMEGEITEVLERAQSRFVGELTREGGHWVLFADGKILQAPVIVDDVAAKNARAGDQVVVEITEFPSDHRLGRGVIIEVLGQSGDPEIDTISMIRQYHLPEEFPPEVLDEARQVIQDYRVEDELPHREDLRTEVIVTIDPDDARDFDDAISIRSLGGGKVELGVHIADVAHMVHAGGAMDSEAARRGNSVYFPRHVIPMLPETLSNGLCSLQEDVPRLAKSVFIQYDDKAKRTGQRFANSVIYSNKRLTYDDATAIIEGKPHDFAPEVAKLVKRMERLARRILRRRQQAGMIQLDLPEVDLVLNDDNEVVDVAPTDTAFSHTIIEMFMVEANEVVSELFTRLGLPHLRRIHPDPPPDSQLKLSKLLKILGRPVPREMDRDAMIRLLAGVRGKPESFAVNLAILRSMAQAEYSPQQSGHFALASKHYAHFTSPIRRYPDLTVHRLFDRYVRGEFESPQDRQSAPSRETLEEVGRKCSYTERRAESAERELKLVKTLRLLEQRLGEFEAGVVTGVTNVGVFVQLERYLVDGLIRFNDLSGDWWDVHPDGGCVVGERSGRRIAIGDRLRVQIALVDVPGRELNLALPAEELKKLPQHHGKSVKRQKAAHGKMVSGRPKRGGPRSGHTAKKSQGRKRRRR